MNELGFCCSIVEALERRADQRPVARVKVRVGRLHRVRPEAFDVSFELAALGTVAEHAATELELVAVRTRCRRCETVGEYDDVPASCPCCGAGDLEVLNGNEFVVERIEYQDIECHHLERRNLDYPSLDYQSLDFHSLEYRPIEHQP